MTRIQRRRRRRLVFVVCVALSGAFLSLVLATVTRTVPVTEPPIVITPPGTCVVYEDHTSRNCPVDDLREVIGPHDPKNV